MISTDRVFLDASVLLAAVGSRHGASSAAINPFLGSERYTAFWSAEVEREARDNLRRKFDDLARLRFEALLGEWMLTQADPSAAPPLRDLPASVAEQDHHVIAGCMAASASICLTLDRRHLLTDDVWQWDARHRLHFLTPGEFLAWHRLREQGGA